MGTIHRQPARHLEACSHTVNRGLEEYRQEQHALDEELRNLLYDELLESEDCGNGDAMLFYALDDLD